MSSHEPRGPLAVDARALVRRPGAMVHEERVLPAPDGFGTDVIAVAAGGPLHVDLRLESVLEGVLASGTVRARAAGSCVRCLDDIELDVDADFQDLFAYPDRAAHHHDVGADDDDVQVVRDDAVDLERTLRDAVVPTLPFQPVCSPDCPGLCSECGAHLADDPDHQHETIDPRWAALHPLAAQPGTDRTEEKRN